MSATSQNPANGKKSGSSSSSTVNTPAQTPVSVNGQIGSQPTPPLNNNAPKYGTLVPNRIFVGGISSNTTESELLQLFSNYGTVKAAKIILDRAGVSRGYGFITFENEDDAKRLQRESDNITLRERKLNIAPAIKKQPFSRTFEASSPPAVTASNAPYYFPPGTGMPFFQGGVAYYPQPPAPADSAAPPQAANVYQPAPPVYPPQSAPPQTATFPSVMFPQPIYMPQQYPIAMPYDYNYYTPNGGPQYVVGNQNGPQPQGPPVQPPGSPPRPPCYNQQLPYNPDAVYYNIPMYPIEGPAVYTDAVDITNSNPYVEEPYAVADGPTQDLMQPPPPYTHEPHPFTIDHQSHHPPPPSQPTSSDNAPSNNNNSPQQRSAATTPDTTRKSNTPVVSLLSLDQRQEKDYISMQGGRRRKSPTRQQQPHPSQHHHHHHHNMMPLQMQPPNNYIIPNYIAPCNFVANGQVFPPMDYNAGGYHRNAGRGATTVNGGSWSRRRRITTNDTFSTGGGSLRSDSNSSASVVDENKNEEKAAVVVQHTGVTSPPPAPYSPMTQFAPLKFSNGVRNSYVTAQRGGRGSYRGYNNNYHHHRKQPARNNIYNEPPPPAKFDGANNNPEQQVNNDFPQVNNVQHFAPPARNSRNRRTLRRGVSTPLSEIGAGDAPLPQAEVTDTCKKLDSLKL